MLASPSPRRICSSRRLAHFEPERLRRWRKCLRYNRAQLMDQRGQGAVLLSVHEAAFFRVIPAVLGPVFLLVGGIMMFVPEGRFGAVVMFLFGIGLIWMAIRRRGKRELLIEVTEDGIMIYARASVTCASFSLLRDLFIPWERLEAMRFITRKQIHAELLWMALGRGPIGPGCIGLKLRTDFFWPPPGTLRGGAIMRRAKPGEIYLNPELCSPTGLDLWKQISEIAERHAGAGLVLRS